MPRCPNCGKDNPDDARFCSACATPMPSAAGGELRKTVTVVFCDIRGSTNLGERLDPESLRQLMARYYERMRTALERHGGTVEKFIGDAVMAVFGVPQVHEDDALRAVRGAVEIDRAIAELNEELEERFGERLEIRTGVNTGEVVAGDSERGESFVVGDAVNVAARLEQAAEPNTILLGATTHALVQDAVRTAPADDLDLRGKSAPVAAYRLLEVHDDTLGHARRLDSPLVGREVELEQLAAAFAEAVEHDRCALATVLGPPGVGKSRLAREVAARLGTGARVLQAHCLPYGEGITFWPIAEIVKHAAAIGEDDSREQARAKIVPLLEGEEDAAAISAGVAEALGLSDSVTGPEQIFWAIRKLLEALAREQPLVVVLDDIHWAEPTLLDLIEYLAGFSHGHAILLLCLSRPELLETRPHWAASVQNGTVVHLKALEGAESRVLIENALGEELAEEVLDRIVEVAEGNPLFVEEMLRMLIDDGRLRREDGRWNPSTELSSIAMPPTIRALLAARLDRLSPPERTVVECASVVGQVFWRGAVVELSPEMVRASVWSYLQSLLRKELIRPDTTPFLSDEDAFRFGHVLIRDAAYEAMLKQARAELHERFADWLEQRAGERLPEYEEILGYHLEQAVKTRKGLGRLDGHEEALSQRAAAHLLAAGKRAYDRSDMPAAAKLLERGLAFVPEEDPARLGLMLQLGAALTETGSLERAERVIVEVAEAARAGGDRRVELHALVDLAALRILIDPQSDLDEGDKLGREAAAFFEEIGDEIGLAQAWRLLAGRPFLRGDISEANRAFERALSHAQRAGDPARAAVIFQWLIVTRFMGPTPAQEAIERSEEFVRWSGDSPSARAGVLMLRGGFEAMAGNFDEARALCAEARGIYEQVGLRHKLATVSLIATTVELTIGDAVAAEAQIRPAYETLQAMNERGWLPAAVGLLAHTLAVQGRDLEADELIAVSEALSHHADVYIRVTSRITRALVLVRRGEAYGAKTLAALAYQQAQETDWPMLRAYVSLLYGLLLQQAGERDEAAARLRETIAACEEKGDVVTAARARLLLERG